VLFDLQLFILKSKLQAKAKVVEPRLWKKAKAAERVRREYRTADEVLAEQSDRPAITSQPILDMRGPQARLVTDMEALNAAEVRRLPNRREYDLFSEVW